MNYYIHIMWQEKNINYMVNKNNLENRIQFRIRFFYNLINLFYSIYINTNVNITENIP